MATRHLLRLGTREREWLNVVPCFMPRSNTNSCCLPVPFFIGKYSHGRHKKMTSENISQSDCSVRLARQRNMLHMQCWVRLRCARMSLQCWIALPFGVAVGFGSWVLALHVLASPHDTQALCSLRGAHHISLRPFVHFHQLHPRLANMSFHNVCLATSHRNDPSARIRSRTCLS